MLISVIFVGKICFNFDVIFLNCCGYFGSLLRRNKTVQRQKARQKYFFIHQKMSQITDTNLEK